MMLTLSCLPWATFAQSITVSPSLIETDAGSNSNTLTVTYEGYNVSNYSPSVQFYDADGITPMESGAYSWLSAFFIKVCYTVVSMTILELLAQPTSGWCC